MQILVVERKTKIIKGEVSTDIRACDDLTKYLFFFLKIPQSLAFTEVSCNVNLRLFSKSY